MVLKKFASLLTAVGFAFSTLGPTYAQSVQDEVEELRTVVDTLSQRIIDLENAESGRTVQVVDMLKQVLATAEAQRRTGLGPEQAKVDLSGTLDTANKAVGSLEKVKADKGDGGLGNSADGLPLLPQMIECATKLRDGAQAANAARTPEGVTAMLSQCESAKVKQLIKDLNGNRKATIEAYQTCREALIRGRNVFAENLPDDPTNIPESDLKTVKNTLAELTGITDKTIECKDQISDLIDDVNNMDNSAAAMGAMMNMAATVCMASGTNPYVCGAIFVVAVLAQLFGGGDGDGDGDGEPGSGQGDANGMGNLPAGNGNGNGPTKPVLPLPKGGVGGDFGADTTGTLKCAVQSGPTLVCSLASVPTTRTTIDPKSVVRSNPAAEAILLAAINGNNPESLYFCSGAPSVAVTEINIIEGQGKARKFTSVGLVPDLLLPGRIALDFGPGGPLPKSMEGVTDRAALTKGLCDL